MQQPRMHSSVPESSQVRTGCTANHVPIASLHPAGDQPIQTLEEDEYLYSTFSRRFGTQSQPHSYLGSWMDQTVPVPSTQETRNTHALDMPYFADYPCTFQQQVMEAPNHTRVSDSFAVLSTMMLGSHAHGLIRHACPVFKQSLFAADHATTLDP